MGKIEKIAPHRRISHDLPLNTGGRPKAGPRIEALVMGDFAMGRELFAIFPMRGTWLHAKTTQHNAMSITCFALLNA